MILTSAYLCMALNLYFESRGEPDLGKELVAQTTLNRAKHDNTQVCNAVLAPKQFSWTTIKVQGNRLKAEDEPIEKAAWDDSLRISKLALRGGIKLDGNWKKVTNFHNTQYSPGWSHKPNMVKLGRVGNHIFYYDKSISQR